MRRYVRCTPTQLMYWDGDDEKSKPKGDVNLPGAEVVMFGREVYSAEKRSGFIWGITPAISKSGGEGKRMYLFESETEEERWDWCERLVSMGCIDMGTVFSKSETSLGYFKMGSFSARMSLAAKNASVNMKDRLCKKVSTFRLSSSPGSSKNLLEKGDKKTNLPEVLMEGSIFKCYAIAITQSW